MRFAAVGLRYKTVSGQFAPQMAFADANVCAINSIASLVGRSGLIAHELTHYAHGFGSHHPRRYRHPHRGNVVQRELNKRGLGAELRFYTEWTNEVWFDKTAGRHLNAAPTFYAARREPDRYELHITDVAENVMEKFKAHFGEKMWLTAVPLMVN